MKMMTDTTRPAIGRLSRHGARCRHGWLMFILGVLLAATSTVALASQPKPAKINETPEGQTYGRWAAEWWQWAFGVPEATNPLLDTTGENCGERQVGDVFFLAGTFSGPAERECTIPNGKSLFFPFINRAFFAFLDDPPEQRTEEFVRDQARCTFPTEISLEIDGVEIRRDFTKFNTGPSGSQSPIFNVQLPPESIAQTIEDDIRELVLTPGAEEGFYVFIKPLSPGEHTIDWLATGCSDPSTTQDITYHLTVEGDDDD